MVERALQIAESDIGVDAEPFNLMKDGRVRGVGRVVAVYFAGNHDAHRRRLQFHCSHLNGGCMGAKKQPVAQRAAFLICDHQRVLCVARRMAGRKVHALEVVVVGFDLRPHAHRVAQRREHRNNLVHGARDGMLGAGQPPRTGQRDVDGLGLERRIGRGIARTDAFQQRLHQLLEHLKPLTHSLFRRPRRSADPLLGDFLEQALLAPQPLEPERLRPGFSSWAAAASARACASSRANAVSSAASSNAVRLGIASFVMPNVQDKPRGGMFPRIPFSRLQDHAGTKSIRIPGVLP